MPTDNQPTTAGEFVANLHTVWAHLLAAPFVAFLLIAIVCGLMLVAGLERRK